MIREFPKALVHSGGLPAMAAHSPDEEEQLKARGYEPIKIPEFNEYPLMMTHPDHEPRREISPEHRGFVPDSTNRDSPHVALATLYNYRGPSFEPEKYPPVTARNAAEEAHFAAKGYIRGGNADRVAFSNAVATKDETEERDFQEYPKWITPPSGEAVLVKSAVVETALRAQWAGKGAKNARSGAAA